MLYIVGGVLSQENEIYLELSSDIVSSKNLLNYDRFLEKLNKTSFDVFLTVIYLFIQKTLQNNVF